jgi:hypothetical protein
MNRFLRTRSLAVTAVASAALVAACASEPEVPPAESQSAVTRDVETPTTVTGCLKAGEAANTYVLTTSQTVDGTPPATYHLTGADNVNLQEHVGNRIEASGVVEAQSDIATRGAAQPPDNTQATSGTTPSVQTSTELSIRRMDVSSVRAVGGECEL